MKKFISKTLSSLVIFWGALFSFSTSAQAFSISSDPQYIVMNFSSINELNWAAPEDEWQSEIKPQILKELNSLKQALPKDNPTRRLAWSTLMEYMNFPMDTPSDSSVYIIKVKRIFEITKQENIPVFLPLNGFQWWDELPELYNWWDSDGTKTPEIFFSRQDNPEDFKKRFIAGYNPDNKWNVEWQNWSTPMNLNWRNWGGGGFRLAPPPNIVGKNKIPPDHLSFRQVQEQRLRAILTEIHHQVAELEKDNRLELFAGVTIGTEVSLNASATPADEFEPYGFRAIQDTLCPYQASCSATLKLSNEQIQNLRQQAVHAYLQDMTYLAAQLGLPKQRVYTHVWSEAKVGEPRYAPYALASFTLYSRPGMSFYGFAEDPFSLPIWKKAHQHYGASSWGAVEYSLPAQPAQADKALTNILNSQQPNQPPAKVIVFYNWSEHKNLPSLQTLNEYLAQPSQDQTCALPEIISHPTDLKTDTSELSWRWLLENNQDLPASTQLSLHIIKSNRADFTSPDFLAQNLDVNQTYFSVQDLPAGTYTW